MTGAAARTASKIPVAIRAALWMVAASACFTVMSACIRPVADELHSFEILFLRSLFAFLLMAPWMLRVGWASLRTRRIGLYVLRAGLFLLSSLIWIYVLPRIPLVDAIALGFTAPFFATVLAALLLGEVVRLRRWTAVIVGFAGAVAILRPGAGTVSIDHLLILVNSLAWAGAIILARVLTRTERTPTVVAYMFVLITPMSLGPALAVWTPPSGEALLWVLGMAAAGIIGHLLVTRALAAAEPSFVAPFEYVQLPLLGLVGYLVYDEVPDTETLVGTAVIVASAIYIAQREARLERAALAASAITTATPAGPRQ